MYAERMVCEIVLRATIVGLAEFDAIVRDMPKYGDLRLELEGTGPQ